MPEVGLEGDSGPWEHWEVAETCGIRPSPMTVRANPGRKVWTLFTLLFCSIATKEAGPNAALHARTGASK